MMEELFAALLIGLSFSNAFVCIFLVFGMSSVERRVTGSYFILGRFIGIILLGMIITSVGLIFEGYIFHMLILFGILTIIFGAIVILKMYLRLRSHKVNTACASCNNNGKHSCHDAGECAGHDACDTLNCNSNGKCINSALLKTSNGESSKVTRRTGLLMGIFRGATPCLKIFILAPLLIIAELHVAFLMILIYATASTIYPLIGFLSANLLSVARKYEPYAQVIGATMLMSIGVYIILKQLLVESCTFGL